MGGGGLRRNAMNDIKKRQQFGTRLDSGREQSHLVSWGGSCWEGDLREGKRKCICISSSQLWSPRHFSPARATPPPCPLSREKQRKQGRRKSCWHSRLAFQDGKVWKIRQHHPFSSKTARWQESSPASVTWPVSCPFPLQGGTRRVFLDPSHPLGAASIVMTKTGSREEFKLMKPPLSLGTPRGKCCLSCVEFQAMIFFHSQPFLPRRLPKKWTGDFDFFQMEKMLMSSRVQPLGELFYSASYKRAA